jgi:hypothetical protein
MKLCKNCKHCGYNQPDYNKIFGYYTLSSVPCLRIPPDIRINLINGDETVVGRLYCWMEREPYADTDACGEEGKYFEECQKAGEV